MSWEPYKYAFEPDGMLRDIYVFDTDVRDWQRVIDYMRTSPYSLEFAAGDDLHPLPDAARIFELRVEITCSLSVDRRGLNLKCYFLTTEEIEFDIDPRDYADGRHIDELIAFMRGLGETVDKPVVLTPESSPRYPLLWFDPARGEIERL